MATRGMPNVWLRAGLVDAKHRKAMGEAVWLYLYLHLLVRFDGPDAGCTTDVALYTHEAAADVLGFEERQVRRHFRRLIDGGYVTAVRRQRGLAVTITKYQAAQARATKRTEAPSRPDTSVRSEEPQTGHFRSPDRTHLSGRPDTSVPSLYKDARAPDGTDDTDVPPTGVAGSRPLAPHQAIVNAWMEAIGRDPMRAKDYGRYTATGSELASRGETPQDVRNCTKYLQTDQWRQEKARQPSLEDVREALPLWREQGRPARIRQGRNGKPLRGGAAIDALWEEAHGQDRGGSRGPAVGHEEAGGGVPRQLRG